MSPRRQSIRRGAGGNRGRVALEWRGQAPYSPGMDALAAAELYESDFHAWTEDQAGRLRALGRRNDGLDVENLAEEVESLGRSQRTAVCSLLARLIAHLLKLQYHPDQQPRRHWMGEVDAFRESLQREFRASPSLRAKRHALAAEEWRAAARAFLRQVERDGLDARAMARRLGDADGASFDLDAEVLNEDWFPPSPAEE